MGTIIIPVGRSLGPFYDDDGELESFELHLGPRVEALDADEIGVWACAHDDPEAHADLAFGRAELAAAVAEVRPELTAERVGELADVLIARGALLEIDLDRDDLAPVLRRHRFIPGGHAFGNHPDAPDECGIGPDDEPLITMSGWCYTLWARSYLDGPVWDACETFAVDLPDVPAADVAREFAEALPLIISADCGYLDPVE